jgi:D-alanine transaminase
MPDETAVPVVYLNGDFVSQEKALISAEDRGFYFADGVYEVIKYYNGKSFRYQDHLSRLKDSIDGVRISFTKFSELQELCNELIRKNFLEEEQAGVYIQVTRGVAPRIHRFPGNDVSPTLYIRAFPLPSNEENLQNGIRVITRDDIRWLRCNIKSIALLPNTMIFQEAVEEGAGECLLVRNGFYTEATHSNVMMVMDGTVYTHPDGNLVLPGITKKVVREICMESGIPLVERPVAFSETSSFSECFITGTGSEVMPVIQINDQPVGDGIPGIITRKLQAEFRKLTTNN